MGHNVRMREEYYKPFKRRIKNAKYFGYRESYEILFDLMKNKNFDLTKIEKQLIEKLNYLVFKDKDANAPGGLLRAYQWASKFESFERLGKQCGFIYYIPAWNTSKIDPVTGFVNLFYTRYESVEESKNFSKTG